MGNALVTIPEGDVDVQRRIRTVRGVQVILDRDLALLYEVETGQLNRHVKRKTLVHIGASLNYFGRKCFACSTFAPIDIPEMLANLQM